MKKILILILIVLFSQNKNVRVNPNFKKNFDICTLCIDTLGETIQIIIDVIEEVGIIGGCQELEKYLEPKVGKTVASVIEMLCDTVGILEFIKILWSSDINLIWMCQEMKLCPINDCKLPTCAKILSDPKIVPNPAEINRIVNFTYEFEILQEIGTSDIELLIITTNNTFPPELGGDYTFTKGYEKGKYTFTWEVDFRDDFESYPPVVFFPGIYTAKFYVCEGECFSKHKHSELLAEIKTKFEMIHPKN